MSDRRTRILDAAIAIIGEGGTRALTHRSIDASVGIPEGSTSNYFRTRGALLDGVEERLRELDRTALTEIGDGLDGGDDALAGALAEYAYRMCRPDAISRTRARFALLLVHPERVDALLQEWVRQRIADLGQRHPEATSRTMLAHTDGVMLQAVVDSEGRGLELDRAALAQTFLQLLRGE